MKEMEVNKITDFFTQIRKALTGREENFKKLYLEKIDREFGYFREDIQVIDRIHTQIQKLFVDINQVTVIMDHMEPNGVVAQTNRVKDFADRYAYLKSTLLDQHPVQGADDVGGPEVLT